MRPMRICYLANAQSIHIRRWANFIAGRGHEVHLISPYPGEGYDPGVRIHLLSVPLPQTLWAGLRAINVIARIIKVRKLVRKIRPDILDAQYISAYGWLAIVSGFRPVVLAPWGSDVLITPRQSFWLRHLIRYALKRAESVICDSLTIREALLALGANQDKISLIYNGIDTAQFRPGPPGPWRGKPRPGEGPVIISTRNLEPVYNIEMLVKAIPLVLRKMPSAHFVILGDGSQRKQLEQLAETSGISEAVSFTGRVPHDELPGYLNSADIYVSTSLSDSTSISLQEAMACELAPVVTDLPANREWISDDGNGFLVPVNDHRALAGKIAYLGEHNKTRKTFGAKSREIIAARADYRQEMAKVEALYRELADRPRPGAKAPTTRKGGR